MKQKFKRGDVVRVADDLGPSMEHFGGKGQIAHIVGSYTDQFGGPEHDHPEYTLLFEDGNETSWYYESQLTFQRHGDDNEMGAIRDARKAKNAVEGDIEWIAQHYADIKDEPPSASIHGLAALLGLSADDLWGTHGEGFDYYINSMSVWSMFQDVLSKGDAAAVRDFGAKHAIRRVL